MARPGWCSCRWRQFVTPRSSRRRLPRLSGWWTHRRRSAAAGAGRRATGRRRWLVLDNFEQVLDAGAARRGDAVVGGRSSRAGHEPRPAPRARRTRICAWGPLPSTWALTRRSPGDLARSPAVRLFLDRVRDVEPGFRLTSANVATVTAICRRLDALPLALELAAPWLKVLSPARTCSCASRDDAPLSTVGAARSSGTSADDERHRRVELSAARCRTNSACSGASACCPGVSRSTWPRPSSPDARRVGPKDDVLSRGRRTDRQEPPRAGGNVGARRGLCIGCWKRSAPSPRSSSARPASATTRWRDWRDIACEEAASAAEGMVGPAQAEWLNRVRDDLGQLPSRHGMADRAAASRRRNRHRLRAVLSSGDPRPRPRGARLVRTGARPRSARAGGRMRGLVGAASLHAGSGEARCA